MKFCAGVTCGPLDRLEPVAVLWPMVAAAGVVLVVVSVLAWSWARAALQPPAFGGSDDRV